jgi:hypothetical protein
MKQDIRNMPHFHPYLNINHPAITPHRANTEANKTAKWRK